MCVLKKNSDALGAFPLPLEGIVTFQRLLIDAPLAPALPPLGVLRVIRPEAEEDLQVFDTGAHCDDPVLPVEKNSS